MRIMEKHDLTTRLNERQREAVMAPPSNLLIVAGAGSGKTALLASRIARLIREEGVSPFAILSVTFTNKAANEMRGRIETLCQIPMRGMWIGTFHGLAHRLLRAHWEEAGLFEDFQIMDSDDQLRLIKRVHKALNLDETRWPPKQSQWYINNCKEAGKRPSGIAPEQHDYTAQTLLSVYNAYEDICKNSGLVDFGELLLRSLELLTENETIRAHYQNRFEHILVDEFQDTNTIQYRWLKRLKGENAFIMAVGDDDQSIYSWRGAKVENMHRFEREFSDTKVIRLEQNYRSTQTILNAANAIIANNNNRLGKNLWTEGSVGEPITLYAAFSDREEAHYIITQIRHLATQGYAYKDFAILYRSNAQSRLLEEQLLDRQMPYRIHGGQKFFERAEIKDALAYLRLMGNPHDDAAFERVVNFPTRGIGNTTLAALRTMAKDSNVSLWQAVHYIATENTLNARATNALTQFTTLIENLVKETAGLELGELTEHTLHRSGLTAHYQKDKTEKGRSRLENLEELQTATSQFSPTETGEEKLSPLATFLSHVALEAGESQADEHDSAVSLMTLHAAKGLEFPIVFIAGLEEELFPHKMSMQDHKGLEEERRLCYVGMTRAKEKLTLTYAESRYIHGSERFPTPSRFIQEIPEEYVESIRPTVKVSRPTTNNYSNYKTAAATSGVARKKREALFGQSPEGLGFNIGQRVKHPKFGSGTLINYEGQGEHARVQVQFERNGTKWLVARFAKLEAA